MRMGWIPSLVIGSAKIYGETSVPLAIGKSPIYTQTTSNARNERRLETETLQYITQLREPKIRLFGSPNRMRSFGCADGRLRFNGSHAGIAQCGTEHALITALETQQLRDTREHGTISIHSQEKFR